jgi:hypothetical protein
VSAPQSAVPTTSVVVGAAPAGLNEAQALAWKRLHVARDAMAAQPPLDPDDLFAERYCERWKDES